MEGGVVRDAHHAHHQHLRKFSRKSARDDDRTKSLRDQNHHAIHRIQNWIPVGIQFRSFVPAFWLETRAVRRQADNILDQLPKYTARSFRLNRQLADWASFDPRFSPRLGSSKQRTARPDD